MSDVYVRFTREGLSGTVAVGSYLCDVMKRLGIRTDNNCDRTTEFHDCELTISAGTELLSELTAVEREHFAGQGRTNDHRLACEARIIKPGEIEIMTNEKEQTTTETAAEKDRLQEEFEALPLEKKIANLVKMEITTLGETVSYVVNSPMKVVEKVGDVIAEFGMKLEREAKKASRPKEAQTQTTENGNGEPNSSAGKGAAEPKTPGGRKPGGKTQTP
jgi:ferredoxin